LKAPGGTRLAERMEKEGRLLTTTDFDEQRINFVPKIPIGELYNGYQSILSRVLLSDGLFERIRAFLKDYKGAQVTNRLDRKLQVNDITTALRILFRVGVFNKNRKMFWKLLIWGLKNHPRKLDLIFLFIILSEHFRHQYDRFMSYKTSPDHKILVARIQEHQNLTSQ